LWSGHLSLSVPPYLPPTPRCERYGSFDEYRLDPERYIDTGASVVVLLIARGRIKGSGLPIDQEGAWICLIANGKAVHVRVYFSWVEGLEEAGLSD
jgi:ketosteroid isomerase-like protein